MKTKFRVWSEHAKEWITNCVVMDGSGQIYSSYWSIEPESGAATHHIRTIDQWIPQVEFFTGLIDKNGKEIYEGDILGADNETDCMGASIPNSEYPYDWWERGVVIYYPKLGRFGLEFYSPYGGEGFTGKEQHISDYVTDIQSYVLGNIHENESLLSPTKSNIKL